MTTYSMGKIVLEPRKGKASKYFWFLALKWNELKKKFGAKPQKRKFSEMRN